MYLKPNFENMMAAVHNNQGLLQDFFKRLMDSDIKHLMGWNQSCKRSFIKGGGLPSMKQFVIAVEDDGSHTLHWHSIGWLLCCSHFLEFLNGNSLCDLHRQSYGRLSYFEKLHLNHVKAHWTDEVPTQEDNDFKFFHNYSPKTFQQAKTDFKTLKTFKTKLKFYF